MKKRKLDEWERDVKKAIARPVSMKKWNSAQKRVDNARADWQRGVDRGVEYSDPHAKPNDAVKPFKAREPLRSRS